MTPLPVARLMAGMFEPRGNAIRLLDAGAGVGSLTAAFVAERCQRHDVNRIEVTAYEVDPVLVEHLEETMRQCKETCSAAGITFTSRVVREDFIDEGVRAINGDLFGTASKERYDAAILNPPYRKLRADGPERRALQQIGVEAGNLYTAFLALVTRLLVDGGQLVAITPRSFCNGPYFRPFRDDLLGRMSLRRIHVFERRDHLFKGDDVIQENVIFAAERAKKHGATVLISSSAHADDEGATERAVPYEEVVRPRDPERFIRLTTDGLEADIAARMDRLPASLTSLGLEVSTGRVVDFRARPFLRRDPSKECVPLIYPGHCKNGLVSWPRHAFTKPNAIIDTPRTQDLLVPAGTYVVVNRFSAKEEKRRVVASVFDPKRVPCERVGFENHLNYFHAGGAGLSARLAWGLSAFLNSTLVDAFFRQFNGHTQVNATDLRSLKYPSKDSLERLGSRVREKWPDQNALDGMVEEELFPMATENNVDPVRAKRKIDEALQVLKDVGVPREQQNERSALTLLALLDLKPGGTWAEVSAPLRGITEMMDFFQAEYGKKYAPNTRETVRRFTVHQFVQAGLAVQNPDEPSRPTNSPNNVYQVPDEVLALLRSVGTPQWKAELGKRLKRIGTLQERYAHERTMQRIPVTVAPGKTITLSAGGQNVLVKQILDEFCARYTPGGQVIYIGDTDEKWAYFDKEQLATLGVKVEEHGKMPDVVVFHQAKKWLVLIEAVTSHGPVNPKRHAELKTLFNKAKVGLVFVTAFLDRKTLNKYLGDIAWETEVWVADAPTHLIHFNGERFLGPYEK
ncbi:MAG: adenine methyltransferase [Acidobacteria bacterium]|nr:MAG: adenine methyltransferase [Acidobacteriota bacterium]